MDMYGFYTGKIFDAYEYLGAHIINEGVVFRTFAPAAQRITLVGDFSSWEEIEMNKVYNGNFYEVVVPNATEGMKYLYKIYQNDGNVVEHCDPYGYGMELRPFYASIIRDMNEYKFNDDKWMRNRGQCDKKPINIYEMHMGSWRTNKDNEWGWYSYEEIADELIKYVKEAGYNYIELMPISEHPCDESWGYQNTGFYSPTSRYGTATQLKKLIDKCHQNNIGVILDFVPVHFAVDKYALANYDGTALYEYPHNDVGVSEWGSHNFMHSRGEVRSFLQSCAMYWLKEYHFDGLRMDAISRIIYWQGDEKRGVNGNAVDFIKTMNQGLKEKYPDCLLIAEDSTNYNGVTKKVNEGGLGFDYKWDMGWMNDTLAYFSMSPEDRKTNYHKLTFSMMYYYNEKYMLPLSHDEVVHGKGTILQKMNGEYEGKFPQGRALYMYMYTHPGKKLNFMGNEIGQLREWSEKREQDWDILKYPNHDDFYRYMRCLNNIYLNHNSLYANDYIEDGFKWLDCHQEEKCIYAYERKSNDERLVVILNLSDKYQENYEVDVDFDNAEVVLNSDWQEFGGKTVKNNEKYFFENKKLKISLEPFSGIILKVK